MRLARLKALPEGNRREDYIGALCRIYDIKCMMLTYKIRNIM